MYCEHMRKRSVAFLFLFVALCNLNILGQQASQSNQAIVQQVCKAPLIEGTSESGIVGSIRMKLVPLLPKSEHIGLAVVQSDVVNAFTYNISPDHAIICLPTAMIALLADAEGELAFMIDHEVGHTLDKSCSPARDVLPFHGRSIPQSNSRSARGVLMP